MSSFDPAQSQSVLVFRIGQLGDTIVSLPAMWAARRFFSEAQFTLLSDRHPRKDYAIAPDLLRGSGLFDSFADYPVDHSISGQLLKPIRTLQLINRLRRRNFDTLLYLAPSARAREHVERDRKFFGSIIGIPALFGMQGFPQSNVLGESQRISSTVHEADHLLARLSLSGVPVPRPGEGSMDLGLGAAEENELDAWLRSVPPSCDRPWIAFGPGSKMPAKRWPLERFFEVGAALIEKRDIWPVVLGGPEEGEMGRELVRRWRRGYNAAGTLSLRGAAAALKRCQLYIGNDTGTMHLAAAVGIPCAAVFAARDQPGKWHPYGQGHRVFRATIECEGCGLAECLDRHNDCLKRVSVQEVVTASIELFHETRRTPPVPTTLTCSTAVS